MSGQTKDKGIQETIDLLNRVALKLEQRGIYVRGDNRGIIAISNNSKQHRRCNNILIKERERIREI